MQNEIIVESYWCNKSYFIYNYFQSSRQKKKITLKPKKREDRLDKDGEAGGVSSMMLSVPIFQYHGVTQTNLKCLVGHMTHFNLYF